MHVKTLFSKGFCAVHESFDGVLQCADSGLHCDPTVYNRLMKAVALPLIRIILLKYVYANQVNRTYIPADFDD